MADHHHHQVSKSFNVKPKLKPKPRTQKQTPESKHWSSFKTHQIPDLFSAVTSVAFSPSSSTFAAAHSASITLFNSDTFSSSSSISSFPDVVSSAAFRSDGLLLAAADLSGLVQVFDVKTRTPLRKLRSHTRPARFVDYPTSDKLHLISGGDDALVKYWDVAAEKPLRTISGHKDYVRCGRFSPTNDDNVFASGSYDHTVRLWDSRAAASSSAVMELSHGAPVEDLAFLPSGGLVATAGGNSVKVWDLLAGGRLLGSMESHNKTVTSLCVAKYDPAGEHRLVSVSLDGYLKVFDYGAMKVTHSMRFPAPLMSLAFSPDCGSRAIGTSNGSIFAAKRKSKNNDDDNDSNGKGSESRVVARPSHFGYFRRGQGEKAAADYAVAKEKRAKLTEYDRLLRKFRHREALVSVVGKRNRDAAVAVIEELVARKKLIGCVESMGMDEIGPLLAFLGKHAADPHHSGLLLGFAAKVVELRADDIRASPELRSNVRNLKRAVDEEIRIQHSLMEIQGVISPLLRLAGK